MVDLLEKEITAKDRFSMISAEVIFFGMRGL